MNRGEEEMLQLMETDHSFQSIASWLSDNIASVSRNSFPSQFLTSGQTTRPLICATTFKDCEARSLRSPVQSASCTAVEAFQAQFPMRPMFPSQACWKQLLSINLPAFLRVFESILHALQSLYVPAHMTLRTTYRYTSKESNIEQSW